MWVTILNIFNNLVVVFRTF